MVFNLISTMVAERSHSPQTSGLWAQDASTVCHGILVFQYYSPKPGGKVMGVPSGEDNSFLPSNLGSILKG